MKQFILLLILSFSFVFSSCEYKLTTHKVIRINYGKQINFNWEKQLVYADTFFVLKNVSNLTPIKVVVYMSRKLCTPCFKKYLSATSDYLDRFPIDSVQYICIMESRPIEEIQEAMDSLELPQTVVIYDKYDQYLKRNSLEKYTDMFRAFLLDKDNRVVLVGDPLRNTNLQKLYTEKIIEMIANGGKLPKKRYLLKMRYHSMNNDESE